MPPINGSFEQPSVGNFGYLSPNGLPGWHTTAASFEVWGNGFNGCFSADGKQNIEILSKGVAGSTSPMNGATVWQDVPTQTGKTYLFGFYHTARPKIRSSLTVFVNDSHICTIDEDGTKLTAFNWMFFSMKFIAAKSSTRLSFFDARTDAPGAAGTHIDGVVLKAIATVPHLQTF